MKLTKRSIPVLVVAISTALIGTSAPAISATTSNHVVASAHAKKLTAQDAITKYQKAAATYTSTKNLLAENPNDKQLKKSLKKATRQMKKFYREAKRAIAKEFQTAARLAKKNLKLAIKGKKNQADVVAAAKAVCAAAVAEASSIRDSQTALLDSLRPI